MAFQIMTDSSTDLSKALREKYDIDYYRMGIVIKGEPKIADLGWEVYTPDELYGFIFQR